jgi:hypothetical protein
MTCFDEFKKASVSEEHKQEWLEKNIFSVLTKERLLTSYYGRWNYWSDEQIDFKYNYLKRICNDLFDVMLCEAGSLKKLSIGEFMLSAELVAGLVHLDMRMEVFS